MAQKFKAPKSETELKKIQDEMYRITSKCIESKEIPKFKGLVEIMSSEVVIMTAIHNIKANKGSKTPGIDQKIIDKDYLQKDYYEVVTDIQNSFTNYKPDMVRRKWIPKPGKQEKRPLGIPTIKDRIVQECVRLIIEPILEAQFFQHSYGFRPWRDTHMALERVKDQVHRIGYYWIVEGDISRFFDNVNHTILIKKLYHMGIADRRILMIIKEMLKAGIMDECKKNELGTPQGGIISPILANVYLHQMDKWITREWENKVTQNNYSSKRNQYQSLHRYSNLKPAYLIRYADDWILLTDSKEHAEKWKYRISKFLETNLKLKLSDEKTLITNIKEKPIHFVGFTYKVIKEPSMRKGYKPVVRPQQERIDKKLLEIIQDIKMLRLPMTKENLIESISKINSKIRGIINYYSAANMVYFSLAKYHRRITTVAMNSLRRKGVIFKPAREVNNLIALHSNYSTWIPAIKLPNEQLIGITSPAFCKYQKTYNKNQEETPFSSKGRELHLKRTRKQLSLARMEEILQVPEIIKFNKYDKSKEIYNYEYFMNRMYAFNRDKGRCKICGEPIINGDKFHCHHISTNLPLQQINKVQNLLSTHSKCNKLIHEKISQYGFSDKAIKNAIKYRKKLIVN
ncbi:MULTISPECIES: group II intron reverse transcriptase/maturase [Bacillota]|jgi:RNA-directed DNA polymerase|uniref:Group II intron reverse transcriptase/maturase n=1 Tax=Clostridium hominis TaxID=2763036 RepID=A0ABR7DIK9_9CLOT|nr:MULTISPECIES: group II intron reverse transcriptase/maturase [Bacillota]MBC5630518.1 group II intron reverse transcriptase/maturase [Clostridium hominis]MBX9185311.1 group II intron reverse transcriptase/maturase [Clostridium sp. K04]MDU7338739.1 group II intron reverse transcriptase/maturase [Clostridium sp.]